jgi:hypothetical protein
MSKAVEPPSDPLSLRGPFCPRLVRRLRKSLGAQPSRNWRARPCHRLRNAALPGWPVDTNATTSSAEC